MPSLRTARDATVGRAAVALLATKLASRLPGARRRRIVTPARAALVGAVGAAVAGLVKSRRSSPASSRTPPPPAAAQSPAGPDIPAGTVANYDAPGPVANTATPLAAPAADPDHPASEGLDEEAEIAAAAAEAGAIGGSDPAYTSSEASILADDAERPLVEAGEGESEGQDVTEADLLDEVTDPYGPGAGMTDGERQIEQAIEDQENPFVGETPDVVPPGGEDSGRA